jgi:hypothetical protein
MRFMRKAGEEAILEMLVAIHLRYYPTFQNTIDARIKNA